MRLSGFGLVYPIPVIADAIQPDNVLLRLSKSPPIKSQDAEVVREAQTALIDLYVVVRAKTENVLRRIGAIVWSTEGAEVGSFGIGP